ncbi:MAG: hypothetical protein ACI3YC_06120 [Alloprevotella sp.]
MNTRKPYHSPACEVIELFTSGCTMLTGSDQQDPGLSAPPRAMEREEEDFSDYTGFEEAKGF